MNLADSIFIFGLALIIFGPKKLPEIGRQIGKLMLEFRRASNEFKMQIEEELRTVEQTDRQKQIADAGAAKNPIPPPGTPAGSSDPLTVRPPSTGTTESTDSPYKPVSVPDETSEPSAGELDSANLSATSDPIPPANEALASSESPATQPGAGTTESTDGPYEPVSVPDEATEPGVSEPDSGDLKIAETAPAVPGPTPYAAGEYQVGENQAHEHQAHEHQADEHRGFQEQATNHHG